MSKEKGTKKKVSFLGYDPIETPEEIINTDKNVDRRDAFKEAYKVVMKIIPEYFLTKRKKRKAGSGASGGNSFTQNIIVTTENVKIETNEKIINQDQKDEKDIEREE